MIIIRWNKCVVTFTIKNEQHALRSNEIIKVLVT